LAKIKNENELTQHKNNAINKLSSYIDKLIQSDDEKENGKADKLSYWIEDYTKFLEFESKFSPKSYQKYKRGQIINVHLGYNIGSEEGGLHYAIVNEKNNSVNSPVLNIVPLTSLKPHKNPNDIRADRGEIFLGNELYRLLDAKISTLLKSIKSKLAEISNINDNSQNPYIDKETIYNLTRDIRLLEKSKKEISKMKKGSIALVGQITTISKIRIYDPKTSNDVLSKIRMSNETLNVIDEAIIKLYTNS